MPIQSTAVPFSLASLQSEVTLNPAALQYVGSTDAQIAAILNTATPTQVPLTNVTFSQLLNLIAVADLDTLASTASTNNALQLLSLAGNLDCSKPNIQALVVHAFSTTSPSTQVAIQAGLGKSGTRAEVLWGAGTVITEQQIGLARNNK